MKKTSLSFLIPFTILSLLISVTSCAHEDSGSNLGMLALAGGTISLPSYGGSGGGVSTISINDAPVVFASSGTYTKTVNPANTKGSYENPVKTYDELTAAIKKGGLIYIEGMISAAYYTSADGLTSGSMLPSTSGGTTPALDAFVKDKAGFANYAAWKSDYISKCHTNTDDKGYSLSNINNLYTAYKKIIQLELISNTTLIGKTSSSGIIGGCISISNVSNVAVRNLILKDAYDPFPHHEAGDGWNSQYDGIVVQNTTENIWIDHCTIEDTMSGSDRARDYPNNADGVSEHWNPYDGQCDIKGNAKSVTVSNCIFRNHDKSMLICSGSNDSAEKNVTIVNCGFYGITQRTPLIGIANVHIYNCYFSSGNGNYSSDYAIGCRYAFKVIAENNHFDSAIKYSINKSSSPTGSIYLSGNIDESNRGKNGMDSYITNVKPSFINYGYAPIEAGEVKSYVSSSAGAGKTVKIK